jgi:hypothetical protein
MVASDDLGPIGIDVPVRVRRLRWILHVPCALALKAFGAADTPVGPALSLFASKLSDRRSIPNRTMAVGFRRAPPSLGGSLRASRTLDDATHGMVREPSPIFQ